VPYLSIVIPIYNSYNILSKTVENTISTLRENFSDFEIILVCDGSPDDSWQLMKQLAEKYQNIIISINLNKNYGQHSAVLCGIAHAKGKYIITMDDDLQNPPSEIIKLVHKIDEGYDLVFAKFLQKKHSLTRRLGSKLIGYINKKIFNIPRGIVLTNFRIFTNEVGKLACSYNTSYPYIPGLLLMNASRVGNVTTLHNQRAEGKSNYSLTKIMALVSRLLFNYSSYPIRVLTVWGFVIATCSFIYGLFIITKGFFFGSQVPGWTSIIVILSFFNGILIVMLGILGVYVVRTLQQVSGKQNYHIKEIING